MVLDVQSLSLNKNGMKMIYFNENGRRIPSSGLRVFGEAPQSYYQIKKQDIDYSKILSNAMCFGGVDSSVRLDDFELACNKLLQEIESKPDFVNILKGTHIPFICKKYESNYDLGDNLVGIQLPNFQKAFNNNFPDYHFKAILQSNSKLPGNIKIDARSRYEQFLEKNKKNILVGWYFPQALQEFDVESQRQQMLELPDLGNLCLSGGIDAFAALIGTPELLINEDFYAPILCLSAYVHVDPRLILLMKSYGPHMEFWCMTQMLTKTITQVSEQWSGGLTFYSSL